MTKLYQQIAALLQAIDNCRASGNVEWQERHGERLTALVREYMPSGSGIDNGTHIYSKSTPNKITFVTSFHHMNDAGMYDGWTDHKVIVTPDLAHGFNLRITGRDRNQIKDYLHDCFATCLNIEIAE